MCSRHTCLHHDMLLCRMCLHICRTLRDSQCSHSVGSASLAWRECGRWRAAFKPGSLGLTRHNKPWRDMGRGCSCLDILHRLLLPCLALLDSLALAIRETDSHRNLSSQNPVPTWKQTTAGLIPSNRAYPGMGAVEIHRPSRGILPSADVILSCWLRESGFQTISVPRPRFSAHRFLAPLGVPSMNTNTGKLSHFLFG